MISSISPASSVDAPSATGGGARQAGSTGRSAPNVGSTSANPAATAVVPVGESAARPAAPSRADASFITQLLAIRAGVPQARLRRRIDPDAGAAAYRSSLGLGEVALPAQAFSRRA